MRDKFETQEHEVGYRKPPISGQFIKGASGNPSGRPKKTSGIGQELLRELNSPLTINENGKRRVIRKFEGVAKQLTNKSLSGHLPSIRLVIDLSRFELDVAAEKQRKSPFNPDIDARELTTEELIAVIQAGAPKRKGSSQPAKSTDNPKKRDGNRTKRTP
jgi:uncharacterized protein DUF5681